LDHFACDGSHDKEYLEVVKSWISLRIISFDVHLVIVKIVLTLRHLQYTCAKTHSICLNTTFKSDVEKKLIVQLFIEKKGLR